MEYSLYSLKVQVHKYQVYQYYLLWGLNTCYLLWAVRILRDCGPKNDIPPGKPSCPKSKAAIPQSSPEVIGNNP